MQDLLAWMLTPISGANEHHVPAVVSWHARLMVLFWGVAVPMAVLAARFYKVTPRQRWPQELDNKFWWHCHRTLNYLAVAGTCVAVLLVWRSVSYSSTARDVHEVMGWMLLALGLLQVTGGQFRGSKGGPTSPRRGADGHVIDLRGDHYDMTPHRLAFERLHKIAGYFALLLAVLTVLMGLWTADAPRWMWLALIGWWGAYLIAFVRLQRQGRCLDTYQAIWGPGRQHPGSQVDPVGWGITRMPEDAVGTNARRSS